MLKTITFNCCVCCVELSQDEHTFPEFAMCADCYEQAQLYIEDETGDRHNLSMRVCGVCDRVVSGWYEDWYYQEIVYPDKGELVEKLKSAYETVKCHECVWLAVKLNEMWPTDMCLDEVIC